jgi:hypothetical protein
MKENAFEHVIPARRDFLKKLLVGAAFAIPVIAAFSVESLDAGAGLSGSNAVCAPAVLAGPSTAPYVPACSTANCAPTPPLAGGSAGPVQLACPNNKIGTALMFSLQSQVTGNLSMTVTNTGTVAATNVTITSITGISASGATFVYVPGLLNPPFVVPGAANLAPGAASGFNLDFTATSGSAATPFSFIITAQADNVAPFTTTINVP